MIRDAGTAIAPRRPRALAAALWVLSLAAARLWADETPSPSPPPSEAPAGRFDEKVTVERVLMEVRVLDRQGQPIRGLAPEDLHVTVDGRGVEVESVEWIDVTTPTVVPEGATQPIAAGRSVVFLFQKDLQSSHNAGLLRMVRRSRDVVDTLPALDRVAVVSFDTHLRLWLDLTTNRQRAKEAIERGVVMNRPLAEAAEEAPALGPLLGPEAARRATSVEKAMRLIGEALARVPGERSLVLVGSHLGRDLRNIVGEDYEAAQSALSRARVAVYSLDITEADHHTLELGMQQVASDTGGFYARTHEFTAQATDRLRGALEGHYLVSFAKPPGSPGFHEVELRLARGGGTILARPGYRDSP